MKNIIEWLIDLLAEAFLPPKVPVKVRPTNPTRKRKKTKYLKNIMENSQKQILYDCRSLTEIHVVEYSVGTSSLNEE